MTGKQMIRWIQENHAEEMEILVVEDEYATFGAHPKIMENKKIKEQYGNSSWLKKDGESVVL